MAPRDSPSLEGEPSILPMEGQALAVNPSLRRTRSTVEQYLECYEVLCFLYRVLKPVLAVKLLIGQYKSRDKQVPRGHVHESSRLYLPDADAHVSQYQR